MSLVPWKFLGVHRLDQWFSKWALESCREVVVSAKEFGSVQVQALQKKLLIFI